MRAGKRTRITVKVNLFGPAPEQAGWGIKVTLKGPRHRQEARDRRERDRDRHRPPEQARQAPGRRPAGREPDLRLLGTVEGDCRRRS